jgi:hypothetical protein
VVATVGFALVAGAAGVGAAYLIPAGHPHAAPGTRRASTFRRATETRATTRAVTPVPITGRKVEKLRPHSLPGSTTTAPATTHPTTMSGVSTTSASPPPRTTTSQATTARVTTAQVTTHPTRTTPVPVTTAPPTTTAEGAVHIVDTFDTPAVNVSVWNLLFNGDGVDMEQRNGKLVVSIAAGATPGGSFDFVSGQYASRGCFSGDIDMQVDFKLDTWPAHSGAYVSLHAVFANAMVERFAPAGGTDVFGSMIDPRFKQVTTTSASGSLRLTRVDGIATTYYLLDGAWQPIDTAPAPGPAHLHIGLSLVPATPAASDVVVELDNFSATAYGPTTC